jgi:hypothetical protein
MLEPREIANGMAFPSTTSSSATAAPRFDKPATPSPHPPRATSSARWQSLWQASHDQGAPCTNRAGPRKRRPQRAPPDHRHPGLGVPGLRWPRGQLVRGISYDGSRQLACDGWTNPCGHIDLYAAVRNEAKRSSNGARHDHRGHSAEWCAVAAADPAVPCRLLVPGGGTVEQATEVPTDQGRQDRVDS